MKKITQETKITQVEQEAYSTKTKIMTRTRVELEIPPKRVSETEESED